MTPLKFGIVGCGAVVTLHQLPAFRRSPAVRVEALVDRDRAWASTVASRSKISASYDDPRRLIGKVDAVLVATPNSTHADISCELLEHGVHVLCEKPLATSGAEGDRMLEAARRGGARLMAAQCLRFSPNIDMLHTMLRAGWLGTIEEVTATIGGPYRTVARRTDFRRQRQLSGGGVLLDLGVHVVDLAVWLAGAPPVEVSYASRADAGWEVESEVEVRLRFPGDAQAALQASFSRQLGNELVVRGSEGWARAPLYLPGELTFFAPEAGMCRRAGVQTVQLPVGGDMYDAQIAHFCRAIDTGEPFRVADGELRTTLDIVDRCYRSTAA